MSENIFSNNFSKTETWSTQCAMITYAVGDGGAKSLPLTALGITVNYARSSQDLYPLNADASGKCKKIILRGAARGTLSISSIFSPAVENLKEYIKAVTKDCKTDADQVTITIHPFASADCSELTSDQKIVLHDVDMDSIQIAIQGGEVALINTPTSYKFTRLELDI